MQNVITLMHEDYEDTFLVGVFGSFQGAAEKYKKIVEEQVEKTFESFFRSEMTKVYQDSNDMPVSTIGKPVFDQSMSGDREYVARHTEKVQDWRETHEKPFRQSLVEYWQNQTEFLKSCDYLYWRDQKTPEKYQEMFSNVNQRIWQYYIFEEAVVQD